MNLEFITDNDAALLVASALEDGTLRRQGAIYLITSRTKNGFDAVTELDAAPGAAVDAAVYATALMPEPRPLRMVDMLMALVRHLLWVEKIESGMA